ncbi:MAG TPA: hypothetical protein VMU99_00065 [Acidimicrobiales bacterium]|nr:hypothetical protein [Acidimicrobiales bacterium]
MTSAKTSYGKVLTSLAAIALPSLMQAQSANAALSDPVTPVHFAALATTGLDGSFSATYALSATFSQNGTTRTSTGSKFSDATVTVGQRSPTGKSAWLDQSGEWYFRLVSSTGKGDEWEYNGKSLFDCVRKSFATPWSCTGPGRPDVYEGNMSTIAKSPFIPGLFLADIRGAVFYSIQRPTVTVNVFGEQCMHLAYPLQTWCLGKGNLVSSWSSKVPSPEVFFWTSAKETSFSKIVKQQSFLLPSTPTQPFVPYMGEP